MFGHDTPKLINERWRLGRTGDLHVETAVSEISFDHVAGLAAALFEVPIASVCFIDRDDLLFQGCFGIEACRIPRSASFCSHTMMGGDLFVVPDARADARFADSPFVTGLPAIRFYAGVPIVTARGDRLGALGIADTRLRPDVTRDRAGLLHGLARIVVDHVDCRRLDTVRLAAMRMAAAIPDAIVCCDDAGTIAFWNAAAERMFGYTRADAMGMPLAAVVPPDLRAEHRASMAALLADEGRPGAGRTVEVRAMRRDGSQFPAEVSVATWRDGEEMRLGAIIRDLSDRNRAQDRMRHLTHFDRLTDLPNRAQFLERIDEALTSPGRFAVLKIGLDRFKGVNGTMGMAAGDAVLVAAAQRVAAVAGPAAAVARLGADEFGLLFAGAEDPAAVNAVAERVVASLGEPFQVGASLCHLGASVGVVLYPCSLGLAGGDRADGVLKHALLALQQAKMAGGRRVELFCPRLVERADERRAVEEELRHALSRGEFELFYQPQVTMADRRIVGVEALLRWRHPRRGLLAPGAFLSVLETSEMAVPVGRWIVREACAFGAGLAARGAPIRVGVNLFAAQLRDPRLFDDVSEALAAAGMAGDMLEVEITETTVLGLDDGVVEPLRRLRASGVRVAFDDYGTGYASLSLLKRYPLTRLKIDREFVRDIDADPDDAAIVRAVIALGASLGLEVIAEGIETAEQATALLGFGCRDAQGYLFGRPMPAAELAALVVAAPGAAPGAVPGATPQATPKATSRAGPGAAPPEAAAA